MKNLPKHHSVNLNTIYGEDLNGTIIPLSIKGTMDVETFIDEYKRNIMNTKESKLRTYSETVGVQNHDDDTLKDTYVEAKITLDLLNLNEEVTEKRIKALKAKRFDRLIEGKSREDLISELAGIMFDSEVRKRTLTYLVSRTLWNVLRKTDILREHLFETVDELEDSLDQDTMIGIFNQVNENKLEPDELKN